MESTQGARTEASARHAGIVLAGAAALTVVTMSQHPSGMHGIGAVNTAVHVSMMVWLSLMLVGFASFAARRGPTHLLVLSGFVAYAVSCIAHLGAATINGFIVPAL